MKRYKVRVWLTDITVIADSPGDAEDKATELIDDELSSASVELAEVQRVWDGDDFRPIRRDER